MTKVAFYYLLWPGEYTGTTADDSPFLLHDVGLHLCNHYLTPQSATTHELEAATAVTYTFTTQKNDTKGERFTHGPSQHLLCCPVTATVRLLKYHKRHQSPPTTPIASYHRNNRLTGSAARMLLPPFARQLHSAST